MPFRPQFWPTVLTVPMLIVLIGLGTWQVQRYGWKTELIDKLNSRAEAPAVDLPAAPDADADLEFMRVKVKGTFLNDHELHMAGRSLRGNAGLHIMTPLRRSDGKGYELVDRGWVPPEREDPATRAEGLVEGEVTVDGIIRIAKGQGMFIPDNNAEKNGWFFVDPPAMAKAAGIPSLPNHFIISGDDSVPGGFPVGKQWRINLPNNHLEYAFTWYSFAVILLVIYVIYHRKRV
jgi:surfeit locus 1 family protein